MDNILPDSVLAKKQGHCLGLTTLVLLAAEKVGLNGALVRAPDHVFPRLCRSNQCINLEMLKDGAIKADQYYMENLSISQKAKDTGVYLKSLASPSELKASLFLGLGYVAAKASQWELAVILYEKSASSSPSFADPYSNLAAIHASHGDHNQVLPLLEKAIRLNPFHYATALNLGAFYQNRNELPKALQFYNQAIDSFPTSAQAYRMRANLSKTMGDIPGAILDLERILILEPRYCDVIAERDQLMEKIASKKEKSGPTVNELKSKGLCLQLQ